MTTIKYNPKFDLPPNHTAFQKDNFIKNRAFVLKELCKIPGFIKAAKSLDEKSIYRLVSTPNNKLLKAPENTLQGVFYKDGKIVKEAFLEPVNPRVFSAIKAIGSQVLLISIAVQINQIERKIGRLFHELENDRLGEINSGLKQFEQAILVKGEDLKKSLLVNTIQTLNTGIEKTIKSLAFQIVEAPGKLSFFDNWGFSSKNDEAREKFYQAEMSFKMCLKGMSCLSESYAVLNEPEAAHKTLASNIQRLHGCDISSAADKARLVPYEGKNLPEEPWLDFLKSHTLIMNLIKSCEKVSVKGEFDIEFKPSEMEGLI